VFINYHLIIVLLKQSPAVHRVHLPSGRRACNSAQRTEQSADQLSRFHYKGGVASKFAEYKTQRTIACGVQCWRLTANLKQSWKQAPNSRKRFRLISGATCHKDRSTRLERLSKVSNWRLVLELKGGGGHFEHLQWQWNSGIWSLVNCVVVCPMLCIALDRA